MSVPVTGGTPTTVVAETQSGEGIGMAVNTTDVFWIFNAVGGTLDSAPIGGGTPTKLFSGSASFTDLAIDGANVYWTTVQNGGGTVKKVPLGGGTTSTMVVETKGNPASIAVDATNVYWSDTTLQAILMVPIAGGTATTLASNPDPNNVTGNSPVDNPTSIAVDATNVYWTNTGSESIQSVPIAGGPSTRITTTTSLEPTGIAVDGTNLYWFGSNGSVLKYSPK